MPVPTAVRYATYAVWAMLGLAALRVILTLAFKDELVDAWIEDNASARTLPRQLVADGAPAYTGVAVTSLVITALLGLAAFNLPKGKNWARITAIVFAALSLLGIAMAFLAPTLAVLMIINVVLGLLSVAVIGLLVNAEANRFFRSAATVR